MNQNNYSLKQKLGERLVCGLQRIQNSNLALPLVPLGGNKQPLGDRWQNRPFTASELITAISNGGVEVSLKGQIRKIPLQGYGLLTGRPIKVEGNTYYLMAVDQDGPSAISKITELSEKTVALEWDFSNLPFKRNFYSTISDRCD